MQFLLEFIGYLKPADVPAALFLAQFIFAIGGATVRLVYDVAGRVKSSTQSPRAFHLGFFLKDNALRIIAGFWVMYGGLFFIDLFIPTDTNPMLRMLASVVVGAFGDIIWRLFEKWAKGKLKTISGNLQP
ncbi:MAG: hypothetical protein K9G46_07160 [Flavobacteriales bacterium]|nr:hypothetical protein [Flavobacteriales bacterium]